MSRVLTGQTDRADEADVNQSLVAEARSAVVHLDCRGERQVFSVGEVWQKYPLRDKVGQREVSDQVS